MDISLYQQRGFYLNELKVITSFLVKIVGKDSDLQ